jgi:hypothetical protein
MKAARRLSQIGIVRPYFRPTLQLTRCDLTNGHTRRKAGPQSQRVSE